MPIKCGTSVASQKSVLLRPAQPQKQIQVSPSISIIQDRERESLTKVCCYQLVDFARSLGCTLE
ncbi:hypothetical protein SBBP1_800018 [Burkholderiales bacterium]|nr:hypothetical protein SBBP1_800018 [Burkholderiales bacterium]